MSSYRDIQTEMVVGLIMKEQKVPRSTALQIWMTSKTKAVLQDQYGLFHISGARCYDELMMEINKNPYWLKGQFD
ncbi:MAG: hypothetical protein IJZ36_00470 [Bacilli bacterium]|nr:hypothetical protein [Bacilli bacterium]